MFLFSLMYVWLFLFLCIISRHDKYNTVYFFLKQYISCPFSLSLSLDRALRDGPFCMLDVCIFWTDQEGNLTTSDLDLVSQIPSCTLTALLGSYESKRKIHLTNSSRLLFFFFFLPFFHKWSKIEQEISKMERLLASFFRNSNIQLGCSLIPCVAIWSNSQC